MTGRTARSHRPGPVVLVRALGVATSALLVRDAYVHVADAGFYDIGTGTGLTQGLLFRAQAGVAVVLAIASATSSGACSLLAEPVIVLATSPSLRGSPSPCWPRKAAGAAISPVSVHPRPG
jgi:hypothetical protein